VNQPRSRDQETGWGEFFGLPAGELTGKKELTERGLEVSNMKELVLSGFDSPRWSIFTAFGPL
jgi:hypothetical protein